MIKRLTKNNNVYHLSLGEFLKVQRSIANKYMCKLKNNTETEIMDKYILQIIEEAWEADNSNLLDDDGEKLEEFGDVLMYVGSLYTIFADRHNIDLNVECDLLLSNEPINLDVGYITNTLISMRRFYPGRKWHKNEKFHQSPENVDRLSMNMLLGLMQTIIKYLLCSGFDIETYVRVKQDIIMSNTEVSVDDEIEVRPLNMYTDKSNSNNKHLVIGVSHPIEIVDSGCLMRFLAFKEGSSNDKITIYKDVDGSYYHLYDDCNSQIAIYKNVDVEGCFIIDYKQLSDFKKEVVE